MQGGVDEGTPSRELGDTYSVSTDPSGDEADTKGISTYQADSMADATSSQSDQVKTNAKDPPDGLSPHPKQAQKDQQISADASGTQDTQHDPAEDAAMQEGDYMDVDTVPISAEELPVPSRGSSKPVSLQDEGKAHQGVAAQPQQASNRPARPKAAVRRRR